MSAPGDDLPEMHHTAKDKTKWKQSSASSCHSFHSISFMHAFIDNYILSNTCVPVTPCVGFP